MMSNASTVSIYQSNRRISILQRTTAIQCIQVADLEPSSKWKMRRGMGLSFLIHRSFPTCNQPQFWKFPHNTHFVSRCNANCKWTNQNQPRTNKIYTTRPVPENHQYIQFRNKTWQDKNNRQSLHVGSRWSNDHLFQLTSNETNNE